MIVLPIPIQIGHSVMSLGPSTALAKDGSSGDDSGHGGGDDSGHDGGGDSGGGNSGPGGGGGPDDRRGGDDDSPSIGTTRKDRQQLNRKSLYGPHGEKIEIRGSSIAIIYPDGFREAIRNGVLELTDPQGRRVVRRPANGSDLNRIRALVHF
jgi:hypothetical protein